MKFLSKLALVALICGSMPVIKGLNGNLEDRRLNARIRYINEKSELRKRYREGVLFLGLGLLMGAEATYAHFYLPPEARILTRTFLGGLSLSLLSVGYGMDDLGYKNGHGGWNRMYNYLFSKKRG